MPRHNDRLPDEAHIWKLAATMGAALVVKLDRVRAALRAGTDDLDLQLAELGRAAALYERALIDLQAQVNNVRRQLRRSKLGVVAPFRPRGR